MHSNFPRLDIGPLSAYRKDEVMLSRFSNYLEEHQNLVFPHRHSFYHLVLFTEGAGTHTIDFTHFSVEPFQIYFMAPGQVHDWNFEGIPEGYVVNFSESFFRSFLLQPDYLDTFAFFRGDGTKCVLNIRENNREEIVSLFERILNRNLHNDQSDKDLIKVILLQIFLILKQSTSSVGEHPVHVPNNIVTKFQKLVDQKFETVRSPGDYAEELNITRNHLNALCKEHLGLQAGQVIRNRLALEIKRLLINLDLSVSQIAYRLNFSDNSYFTRFFRKETGETPEEFRRKATVKSRQSG
ncbi:helix-turn-helix transcriptional regulator [Dyadobacter sp. CY323]|uniref:AraC family transcriptional regulator n=1 Tax=Dyadobacter sp. CY323 TaxID=2907302 RepID=UPI001F2C619D|nr:helix-turn-helix transcriptional regulator [Dyadobacter sp. CY323]MCE6987838.1 AraC family transcriptional regulator [Dyadobacter sp. CY323]